MINNKIFLLIKFQSNLKEYFSFFSKYKLNHHVNTLLNPNAIPAQYIPQIFIQINVTIIVKTQAIQVIYTLSFTIPIQAKTLQLKDDKRLNNKNIHACDNNTPEVKYCFPNKAIDISGHSTINKVERLNIKIEK